MEKELIIKNFTPYFERDLEYLANLINGYNFKADSFYVAILDDGRFYWTLKFKKADLIVTIFSMEFALARDILKDISTLADFFYSRYTIELQFPRFFDPAENKNN